MKIEDDDDDELKIDLKKLDKVLANIISFD